MELKESKNIKVYGTLVNDTVGTITDNSHNDALANAYQLYDGRFGAGGTEDYQDRINKRLTGITYDPNSDTTTIDNNLIVTGDTNLKGDLNVDGDSIFEGPVTFKDDVNIQGDIDLDISLNDLSDVNTNGQTAGNVLKFDGTNWVPAIDERGASKLSDLDDVDSGVDNPVIGLVLYYNGSTWTSRKLSLSDIQMPNAIEGQVLKYVNGQWIAANDETGSGSGGNTSTTTYTFTFRKVGRQLDNTGFDGYGADILVSDSTADTSNIVYPKSNYSYVYLSDEYFDIDENSIISTEVPDFDAIDFKRKYYPSNVSLINVANKSVSLSGDGVRNDYYGNSRLNFPTYVITRSTTNSVTPIEKSTAIAPYGIVSTTTINSTEKLYISSVGGITHIPGLFVESELGSTSGYSGFSTQVSTTTSPETSSIGEWYSLLTQSAIDRGDYYSRYIKHVNTATNGSPNVTVTKITKNEWLNKFPSFTPTNAKQRVFITSAVSNSMPDTITVKITVSNS